MFDPLLVTIAHNLNHCIKVATAISLHCEHVLPALLVCNL
jgi:hypothetical protein